MTPTPTDTTPLDADPRVRRSRAAVVDAAVALFLDGGVGAVTLDAVAARSGVAKTTIYRHWANRQELLLDVLRRFALDLRTPPPELPPVQRVRLVLRELAALLTSPEWQRAFPSFFGMARHKEELVGLRERLGHRHTEVIGRVLADAVAAGALPPETDLREAVFQLVGPVLTASMMSPGAVDDAFVDRFVDLSFASRRPHPVAARGVGTAESESLRRPGDA